MTTLILRLLLLLTAHAPAYALVSADCTWGSPGANAYTGSKHAAVMSFTHIRYDKRVLLSLMVQHRPPSDIVSIGRSSITGHRAYSYDSSVNGMHFGRGQVCATVTRDGWSDDHIEVAKAYCLQRWCVLVPDVCGNVSWTVRDELPAAVLLGTSARAVPEPSSLWLVLLALAMAAISQYRRRG